MQLIHNYQTKHSLLALFGVGLFGCGGGGGGSSTTVTAIEEPQAPYSPELAANTAILNLKDNGNVDVESVENTARLVSVFYDEVIQDIFDGLDLSTTASIDELKSAMSGKNNELKNGYRKTYLISNDVVTISYDAGNALSFPTKYVFEDQSDVRGDTYENLGYVIELSDKMVCDLRFNFSGADEYMSCFMPDNSEIEMSYKHSGQSTEYKLKVDRVEENFPNTSVSYDPNTNQVLLNNSNFGFLNNDTTITWTP
ncbi:hypothetical protein [Vibrio splendidus]|uniref:hypothetical protein n=1 Tax=Vibrio splendidus TaxID=29497 RepID=UPI00021C275F|nr:hypothetical protein [Vibrio splendidus]EGU42097.1 hypothetical protein VISP3789_10339 [Vibrio splendidus ATCC 33789]